MPKINKVVTTVWYNKEDMHSLRYIFPQAEFVYVDFWEKDRLKEEAKDADAALLSHQGTAGCAGGGQVWLDKTGRVDVDLFGGK